MIYNEAMKTYQKVLIFFIALIADIAVTYYGIRLALYIGWAQGSYIDIWTFVLLAIFATPFAVSTVIFALFELGKWVYNIYTGIRYGRVHNVHNDDYDRPKY